MRLDEITARAGAAITGGGAPRKEEERMPLVPLFRAQFDEMVGRVRRTLSEARYVAENSPLDPPDLHSLEALADTMAHEAQRIREAVAVRSRKA